MATFAETGLYANPVRSASPVALTGKIAERLPGHSRPEALGSPAGYVVQPGHRLLPEFFRFLYTTARECFVDSLQDTFLKFGEIDDTRNLESVVLIPEVNLIH